MKILVIEACGLHLGYLGCYGNDWVATPNLDRLAAQGITFDWHFADQPELLPTTPWADRSVGVGNYAFPGQAHGRSIGQFTPGLTRCAAITSLAGDIQSAVEAGDAWHWLEGPRLLPPWNLDNELLESYFDEDDIEEGLAPWADPPLGPVALNDAEILQLQNTYAAAVTVFDAQLGVALDRLRECGILNDLLLCVTARSGLPLGEHGMIGASRPMLHDELVHLPLLLRLPGAAHAGMRIGALTQPIDLLPTFLDALGQPIEPMHGRNLWPLIRGESETVRPYAVSALCVGGEESWLLRTPDWAFHAPVGERSPQLFAKPGDRWEVNDLYQQQVEIADPMARTLQALAETIRRPGELTYPPIQERAG
jgi:arylsulfatase A-like enzyme